jgi:TfoX/Sxy family transcriptional regulator of competence genes
MERIQEQAEEDEAMAQQYERRFRAEVDSGSDHHETFGSNGSSRSESEESGDDIVVPSDYDLHESSSDDDDEWMQKKRQSIQQKRRRSSGSVNNTRVKRLSPSKEKAAQRDIHDQPVKASQSSHKKRILSIQDSDYDE